MNTKIFPILLILYVKRMSSELSEL